MTDDDKNTKSESLSGKLLTGIGWTIGIRWSSKALGIISLAICARILTPADYGLVSMATVVVGFASLLVELGVETSLIRTQNCSAELYDTAWSMRIIQRGLIAIMVLGAAPIAASIYGDDRVTLIMVAVGLAELFCAFENIYTVNLRKHLNFRADFIYMAAPRFASFITAVSSVILLENYWGLVIGICTIEVIRTVVSYLLVKERPKWSLTKWRDILGFSTWYMLRGLGDFISSESDRFILGVFGGPKVTGIFNVAKEIATLPVTEIVLPIGRALTPTLAKISEENNRLSSAIGMSIAGTMIIAAPASLGFVLISHEFVTLLFGEKWLDAIPILSILCIGGPAYAIKETASNALITSNKVKLATYLSWINATLIVSLFYPIYLYFSATGVAWLYVITGLMTAITSLAVLTKLSLISLKQTLSGLTRSILSSLIMFVVIYGTITHTIHTVITTLILKILLGAAIYSITLTGLWIAAGKPKSSESIIIYHLHRFINNKLMQ